MSRNEGDVRVRGYAVLRYFLVRFCGNFYLVSVVLRFHKTRQCTVFTNLGNFDAVLRYFIVLLCGFAVFRPHLHPPPPVPAELRVIGCVPTSISVTECPLSCLCGLHHHLWWNPTYSPPLKRAQLDAHWLQQSSQSVSSTVFFIFTITCGKKYGQERS